MFSIIKSIEDVRCSYFTGPPKLQGLLLADLRSQPQSHRGAVTAALQTSCHRSVPRPTVHPPLGTRRTLVYWSLLLRVKPSATLPLPFCLGRLEVWHTGSSESCNVREEDSLPQDESSCLEEAGSRTQRGRVHAGHGPTASAGSRPSIWCSRDDAEKWQRELAWRAKCLQDIIFLERNYE